MSSIKKKNQASLHSFFTPLQPVSSSPTAGNSTSNVRTKPAMPSRPGSASSATFKAPYNFPHAGFGSSTFIGQDENAKPVVSQPAKTSLSQSSNRTYTSSLSPPPSSDISDAPPASKPIVQATPVSTQIPSAREIRGSDDEDSDSSIDDLIGMLGTQRSSNVPKSSSNSYTPSTPVHSKTTRSARINDSPLVRLPKSQFDLASLARLARKDNATEASSKRVKSMVEPVEEAASLPDVSNISRTSRHNDRLESLVAETDGGEFNKITRALDRTEATLSEYRWYFFKSQIRSPIPERSAFPTKSVPDSWRNDLKDPTSRYQTLVSGFAEDMVVFGKNLPDEIFLWILNELYSEPKDVLRSAYSNVLLASTEQVTRLVVPEAVQNMFQALGGSLTAVTVSEVIRPVQEIKTPYRRRDLAKLRSLVKFLGQASKSLQQSTKVYIMCILLRMGLDRVVTWNVDLYDSVQDALFRLCKSVPGESWESFCTEICQAIFNCVAQSIFRLQLVETLPSTSPKTHDLRRRLAMCFYFNELSPSTKHSHHTMDLNLFINRLMDTDFAATNETDYRELGALISLLDIAVDDARSIDLDLTDRETEKQFDADVERFALAIKDIMRSIGTPGPGFISKIEAKELLELVSQRIGDILRSRPKLKQGIFAAPPPKDDDLGKEKSGMAKFLSRKTAGPAKHPVLNIAAG